MNAAPENLTIRKTHPKTGLISFGLAIVVGFIALALFVISSIFESGTYARQRADGVFFVFTFVIAPFFHLIGLILGIVGAFGKNSKKLFPILGIIFNIPPLIFAVVVLILLLVVGIAVIGAGGVWV